jgi:hypothetical protein
LAGINLEREKMKWAHAPVRLVGGRGLVGRVDRDRGVGHRVAHVVELLLHALLLGAELGQLALRRLLHLRHLLRQHVAASTRVMSETGQSAAWKTDSMCVSRARLSNLV